MTHAKDLNFSVIINEKGGAERRELFTISELTVGRIQGNDLMLPKGNVSKHHARILYRDGRFIVTDLNSTNGTYVNRRRISQATIVRDGDRIYVGDFVLRVQAGEAAALSSSNPVPNAASRGPLTTQDDASLAEATPNGAEYPPVPRAPRVPEAMPGTPEQESVAVASSVRASARAEPSRASAGVQAIEPPTELQARRQLVVELVERLQTLLGPSLEAGEIAPTARARVEAELSAAVSRLKAHGLPPGLSAEMLYEHVFAELVSTGPIAAFRRDADTSELAISRFDRVSVRRRGSLVWLDLPFSNDTCLRRALGRLCQESGRALLPAETEPGKLIERRLPDGTRLSAVCSQEGILLVLRKPRASQQTLEELVRQGTVSRAMATFLQHCVGARANILIVGDGAGAVLNALSAASPTGAVATHEASGLWSQPQVGTRISLSALDPAASLATLRLAAKTGACVAVEMEDASHKAAVVDAIGDGAEGIIATYASANLRRAFARFPADVAGARPGVSIEVAREWVVGSFDIAVEVATMRDGRLRVVRVAEPRGTANQEVLLDDIFTFSVERTATGGSVEGSFAATGVVPRIIDVITSRGVVTEGSLFTRPSSR